MCIQPGFLYLSTQTDKHLELSNYTFVYTFVLFFVSRMIEEGGNKRKTMAEKRQLFIEMRESSGILVCINVWECLFSPPIKLEL